MVTHLVDPADDRLADYRALTDVELRTRWEPPHGLFIAEGELVLRRAIKAGYPPRSFLVDAKRVDQIGDLVDLAPVYAAEPPVLRAITGFNVHRGLLASFHRKPPRTVDEVLANATRLVVLEDINNHTNLEGRKWTLDLGGAERFWCAVTRLPAWGAVSAFVEVQSVLVGLVGWGRMRACV